VALNSEQTRTRAEALRKRHPLYVRRLRDWDFYLSSYEGGAAYLGPSNIFRYVKEPESAYIERLRRAAYYNYCAPIVDLYNAHLFRQGAVRITDDGALVEFFEDVDGFGTPMDAFMKEAECLAQVFGKMHVVVDQPATRREPQSAAEAQRLNLRPYLVKLDPRDLVNWQMDEAGALVWARIRERSGRGEDPFEESAQGHYYRTWTRTGWFLHTAEGELKGRGEHGAGRVPIATLYDRSSKTRPFMGISTLEDIAYINRQINNWASSLDEFILKQCFSHLFYPEGMFESSGRDELVEFGMNNATAFPRDAAQVPFYLAPEAAPGEFIRSQIAWAVGEIYRLAKLENAAGRQVQQVSSGIARAFDFQETNRTLADKAARCERCEREIVELVEAWRGKKGTRFTVNYGRDFNVQGPQEELEEILTTIRIPGVSPTLVREQIKRAAKKLLPGAGAETIVKIEREIESEKAWISKGAENGQ